MRTIFRQHRLLWNLPVDPSELQMMDDLLSNMNINVTYALKIMSE